MKFVDLAFFAVFCIDTCQCMQAQPFPDWRAHRAVAQTLVQRPGPDRGHGAQTWRPWRSIGPRALDGAPGRRTGRAATYKMSALRRSDWPVPDPGSDGSGDLMILLLPSLSWS